MFYILFHKFALNVIQSKVKLGFINQRFNEYHKECVHRSWKYHVSNTYCISYISVPINVQYLQIENKYKLLDWIWLNRRLELHQYNYIWSYKHIYISSVPWNGYQTLFRYWKLPDYCNISLGLISVYEIITASFVYKVDSLGLFVCCIRKTPTKSVTFPTQNLTILLKLIIKQYHHRNALH